jgi:hypothetical protein
MEKLTKKWWFYLILILSQFLIPPIATKNFDISKWGEIIQVSLKMSITNSLFEYNIYFQITAIIMLTCLFIFKNRIKKIFSTYVILSYILFALGQNIAITETYGLSVITINLIMFLLVAYVWLIELINGKNDYSFSNLHWKYSWMILFALFAFWCPINNTSLQIDFHPKYFLINNSSLAFCLMTPVYLTIMTLNLPNVNFTTYRITSIIGLIIGVYNMFNFFSPSMIWIGLLHIPLILISLYAFILSFKISDNGQK